MKTLLYFSMRFGLLCLLVGAAVYLGVEYNRSKAVGAAAAREDFARLVVRLQSIDDTQDPGALQEGFAGYLEGGEYAGYPVLQAIIVSDENPIYVKLATPRFSASALAVTSGERGGEWREASGVRPRGGEQVFSARVAPVTLYAQYTLVTVAGLNDQLRIVAAALACYFCYLGLLIVAVGGTVAAGDDGGRRRFAAPR